MKKMAALFAGGNMRTWWILFSLVVLALACRYLVPGRFGLAFRSGCVVRSMPIKKEQAKINRRWQLIDEARRRTLSPEEMA